MVIKSSELILNPDGSVYHLNLLPGQIAHKIITVGDPERVSEVTKYFDEVEFTIQKREFKTSTGSYKGSRLTVISTGIGTDNIDIVFNELDALVNIDLQNRVPKDTLTSLEIYRIGTSGSMREDIPVDAFVVSEYAIGMDNLLHYYKRNESTDEISIRKSAEQHLSESLPNIKPYVASGSKSLIEKFRPFCTAGITVTCSGFYGPQGRKLRLETTSADFLDQIKKVTFGELLTTNFEMETSGIYGMSQLLGHNAVSLNAIMANRASGTFSTKGQETVDLLIQKALKAIVMD